jgi:hypothetical protein
MKSVTDQDGMKISRVATVRDEDLQGGEVFCTDILDLHLTLSAITVHGASSGTYTWSARRTEIPTESLLTPSSSGAVRY